jgi:hypothetical protein
MTIALAHSERPNHARRNCAGAPAKTPLRPCTANQRCRCDPAASPAAASAPAAIRIVPLAVLRSPRTGLGPARARSRLRGNRPHRSPAGETVPPAQRRYAGDTFPRQGRDHGDGIAPCTGHHRPDTGRWRRVPAWSGDGLRRCFGRGRHQRAGQRPQTQRAGAVQHAAIPGRSAPLSVPSSAPVQCRCRMQRWSCLQGPSPA